MLYELCGSMTDTIVKRDINVQEFNDGVEAAETVYQSSVLSVKAS